MLFEPIVIELDRPRKLLLNIRALMRAEREINRRNGVNPNDKMQPPIDGMIFQAVSDSRTDTGFYLPLNVLVVLLWAGLSADDPGITVEQVSDMLDASPLTRGAITGLVWDHYVTVTRRPAPAGANGADRGESDERADPLPQRPGSISGALQ